MRRYNGNNKLTTKAVADVIQTYTKAKHLFRIQ